MSRLARIFPKGVYYVDVVYPTAIQIKLLQIDDSRYLHDLLDVDGCSIDQRVVKQIYMCGCSATKGILNRALRHDTEDSPFVSRSTGHRSAIELIRGVEACERVRGALKFGNDPTPQDLQTILDTRPIVEALVRAIRAGPRAIRPFVNPIPTAPIIVEHEGISYPSSYLVGGSLGHHLLHANNRNVGSNRRHASREARLRTRFGDGVTGE